jgi:hypothetical protein
MIAARTIMSVSIALTWTFPSTWRDERRSNCLMNSQRVQLIYRTGFHLLLSPEHFWEISSVWKNPVKLSSLDTYHSSNWNRLLGGLRWCFSLCVHFDILPFVFWIISFFLASVSSCWCWYSCAIFRFFCVSLGCWFLCCMCSLSYLQDWVPLARCRRQWLAPQREVKSSRVEPSRARANRVKMKSGQ